MSIFGSDDPLDDLISDEADDESQLPTADEWKYAFTPLGTDHRAGREMYTAAEDEMYAGEVVRQMIESRRFRPDSYTWFGYTQDPKRGVEEVGVPYQSLFTHTVLFGASGYGKSTVMQNMLLQWMQAEYGVCFVDPKGDDSVDLLRSLPDHRRDDFLWVEPGVADREQAVGFNFFDTHAEPGTTEHAEEAEQVADQFVELLEVFSRDWSPQMSGTAKAIVEQLVKADEEYTPIDFYAILDSPAERDAFLEMYGDNMEDIARNYVDDFDPQAMQGLVNQVQHIVSKPVLREMIANEDATVSLAECVEDEKVMLANVSNLSDDEDLKLVTAAFVRRIWSTIKARSGEDESTLSPFYLAIDELKDVTKQFPDDDNKLKLGEIISKARSLRLSLMMATQQPSQLPEDIKEEVYACENLFSFNTGDWNDAGDIANGMYLDSGRALTDLAKFTILGQVTIDGSPSDPLLIHTFPKYPPLRTEEEGQALVDESIANYGSPRKRGNFDMDSYGVERYQDAHEATSVSTDDVEISPRHVLAALASTQARTETASFHGYDDWVSETDLESLFESHTPTISYTDIERDIIRPLTDKSIEQTEEENTEYFRLTAAGVEDIFTGAADGAEGDLALAGLQHLSTLGEQVTLPIDDNDAAFFHGEAEPPIKPTEQAETMDEAETLHMALQTTYDDIAQRFRDYTVMLAANPNPHDRIRDFAAGLATRKNRHVAFAVPERAPAEANTPHGQTPPEFAANLLTADDTAPAFVKEMDADRYRTFHTSHQAVELEAGGRVLITGDAEWCERGQDRHLALVDENGDEIATFDDLPTLRSTVDPAQFPYHCEWDGEAGEWLVKNEPDQPVTDEEGEEVLNDEGDVVTENPGTVTRYESLDDIEADGYTIVREPFVPESILPSRTPDPHPDTWSLIVVPDSGDPYIYDDGDDVAEHSATAETTPDTAADESGETIQSTPQSDTPEPDPEAEETTDSDETDPVDIDESKWEFGTDDDDEDDTEEDETDGDVEDPFGPV